MSNAMAQNLEYLIYGPLKHIWYPFKLQKMLAHDEHQEYCILDKIEQNPITPWNKAH